MSHNTSNNENISNEIRDKNKTAKKAYRIIILCSLIILETSQGILPYPPISTH